MRRFYLLALFALLGACNATPPQRCFTRGDTAGWIIVRYEDGREQREPIPAVRDFCL